MSASMDFDQQVFIDMRDVAETVGGNLALTEDGRVVIYGVAIEGKAVALAERIDAGDFPHGFVVADDDDTLAFEF